MRMFTCLLLAVLSFCAAPAFTKEPTDAELQDWVNYLRSVGLPSIVKICGPALQDEAKVTRAVEEWTATNKESVERGRALVAANPPKGSKSVDEYNAGMIRDMEAKMTAMSQSDRLATCEKYLSMLEQRAKQ